MFLWDTDVGGVAVTVTFVGPLLLLLLLVMVATVVVVDI